LAKRRLHSTTCIVLLSEFVSQTPGYKNFIRRRREKIIGTLLMEESLKKQSSYG